MTPAKCLTATALVMSAFMLDEARGPNIPYRRC